MYVLYIFHYLTLHYELNSISMLYQTSTCVCPLLVGGGISINRTGRYFVILFVTQSCLGHVFLVHERNTLHNCSPHSDGVLRTKSRSKVKVTHRVKGQNDDISYF